MFCLNCGKGEIVHFSVTKCMLSAVRIVIGVVRTSRFSVGTRDGSIKESVVPVSIRKSVWVFVIEPNHMNGRVEPWVLFVKNPVDCLMLFLKL